MAAEDGRYGVSLDVDARNVVGSKLTTALRSFMDIPFHHGSTRSCALDGPYHVGNPHDAAVAFFANSMEASKVLVGVEVGI
jgi:hypothetical protein